MIHVVPAIYSLANRTFRVSSTALGIFAAGLSFANAQLAPPSATGSGSSTLALNRATEPSISYTVQPKDKLIVLSRTLFNGLEAWAGVARYNGLKDPNLIYPGQKLDVPLRYLASKPSTGKVVSVSGDVRSDGQPVLVGSPVQEGQQFKTGANSSVRIELGDASRIKLLPNTLAQVVSNKDYAMRDSSASGSTNWFSGLMRLTSGALEAIASKGTKRATELGVETPTSTLGVRGTEFRVAFDDPAGLSTRTEVLAGLVGAESTIKGAGADLPRGTGAVVKALDRDIKVFNLLSPPDPIGIASEIFLPQASLSLPQIPGATSYRVLVSSDDKFDTLASDLKVPANAPADLSGLAAGNWYALVRSIDSNGLEGFDTIKQFSIRQALPVDSWRSDGSRLVTLSTERGLTQLQWTASPGDPPAKSYLALIGQTAGSLQPAQGGESSGRSLNLGSLTPGVYFIRLRTTMANGQSYDSGLYRFELSGDWGQTVFGLQSALTPSN